MTNHEQRIAHDGRDAESAAGLAHAAMFRELDRALDEVRTGLALEAWGRRRADGRVGRAREIEPS
jgi:hypothetical protein